MGCNGWGKMKCSGSPCIALVSSQKSAIIIFPTSYLNPSGSMKRILRIFLGLTTGGGGGEGYEKDGVGVGGRRKEGKKRWGEGGRHQSLGLQSNLKLKWARCLKTSEL